MGYPVRLEEPLTNNELATRVEHLERGMRRWRRLASVLVLGLAVVGTVAATRQEEIPDVVKARQFDVINKDGVWRSPPK